MLTFSSLAYENYTLIADKEVTNIPIKDSHEEMVDLATQTDIAFGSKPDYSNTKQYTLIRKTVYEKLKVAQSKLPKGLKLCVYEGYRSPIMQASIFRLHFQQVQAALAHLSYEELFKETTKMVAPARNIDGTENNPPHATGGAVAIYLIDDSGKPVDMGIQPKDWSKDKDGSYSRTFSSKVTSKEQKYRDIMSDALKEAGFVNYPSLYWHWSYGDQYWAHETHHDYAIYGNWENG
jgi:D-alanyl-D-alanine dipeptidase